MRYPTGRLSISTTLGTISYSKKIPCQGPPGLRKFSRQEWFEKSLKQLNQANIIFLDPDNGLEVMSKPYGRKCSSKYVYWREVEALWLSGKSLLIYQHFIHENRFNFIQRILEALRSATPDSFVEAFSTPHVVFLMALQPKHQRFHSAIISSVQGSWEGQIQHWELTLTQQGAPS